jgi:ARG and Rhodanese-Phosphatase-superfamily-associated Protein domain
MIETSIQVGDPAAYRGVVVTPLFPRRTPVAPYLTLSEALPLGLRVTEIDKDGSVPELAVVNPLPTDVLLYDGEELVGARQNRILNVTVLVSARSAIRIPVSCVEEGRWDARSDAFSAATHTASPGVRSRKAAALEPEPLARGVAQGEVWDAVAAEMANHGVDSPTAAQSDLFHAREQRLGDLRAAFPLVPGQSGAVLAVGAQAVCLDWVSRPEAFVRLYPKLLDGYLLDALERLDQVPAPVEEIDRFISALAMAAVSRRPSAGRGTDLRVRGVGCRGSGLELDGELLQLSAFIVPDLQSSEGHRRR